MKLDLGKQKKENEVQNYIPRSGDNKGREKWTSISGKKEIRDSGFGEDEERRSVGQQLRENNANMRETKKKRTRWYPSLKCLSSKILIYPSRPSIIWFQRPNHRVYNLLDHDGKTETVPKTQYTTKVVLYWKQAGAGRPGETVEPFHTTGSTRTQLIDSSTTSFVGFCPTTVENVTLNLAEERVQRVNRTLIKGGK
ncbi:hypothetical protein H6P81_002450 [Aristolochia fimbriata]|uniref:Uncharacterized protein n=1 Tax=Aristolochia fimbriata TaxID=158543 RepID=A0AAV7F9T0_ARIFI|nr:hypothetical protein H6P81_002450 [Aristolochia fimbriata]